MVLGYPTNDYCIWMETLMIKVTAILVFCCLVVLAAKLIMDIFGEDKKE